MISDETYKEHFRKWHEAWQTASNEQIEQQLDAMRTTIETHKAGIEALEKIIKRNKRITF